MEKLCEICGKPVTSDLEGSWGFDKEGKPRYFHTDCLRERGLEHIQGEVVVQEISPFDERYPSERAKKAAYRP